MREINFNIENNDAYKYNRLRTGIFTKENKKFCEKYNVQTILDVLRYTQTECAFDAMSLRDNNYVISLTGCNYGVLLLHINPYFQVYLYNKYLRDKLHKNFDIEFSLEDRNFKYYDESIPFNKKIKKLIILSSVKKHKILDWNKLNNIMYQEDSYLKLHPIMDYGTKQLLAKKFGADKLIHSNYILDELIESAEEVGFTGCTEAMITISLMNKKMIFLHEPHLTLHGVTLTYYPFYKGLYENYTIKDIVNSGVSGLIPWKYLNNKKFIVNYMNFIQEEHVNWKNSIYNNTQQR